MSDNLNVALATALGLVDIDTIARVELVIDAADIPRIKVWRLVKPSDASNDVVKCIESLHLIVVTD